MWIRNSSFLYFQLNIWAMSHKGKCYFCFCLCFCIECFIDQWLEISQKSESLLYKEQLYSLNLIPWTLMIKMKLLKALFLSLLMHCSGLEKTLERNISETSQMLHDMVNTTLSVSDLVNTLELSTSETSLIIPDMVNSTLQLSNLVNT